MAKHPSNPDPLMNVLVEAVPAGEEPKAKAPEPAAEQQASTPLPPAAPAKRFFVKEAVPRISINGQMTNLPAGLVISELGYDVPKLLTMGVKLEPVIEG